MDYRCNEGRAFIRMDRDEDLFGCLEEFAIRERWQAAVVSGIGTVKEVELAYYRLDVQEHRRRELRGTYELVSLSGNLSRFDGKPLVHLCATLACGDFQCFGGRVFRAKVAATCELTLERLAISLVRAKSPELGVPLIIFDEH